MTLSRYFGQDEAKGQASRIKRWGHMMKALICALILSCVAGCASSNTAQRISLGMPLAEAHLILGKWRAAITSDKMNPHPRETQWYFVNLPDGRNYVLTVSVKSGAVTAISFMRDPGGRSTIEFVPVQTIERTKSPEPPAPTASINILQFYRMLGY